MRGHLYVLEFDDDVIKVGRSADPKTRVVTSSKSVQNKRDSALVRHWISRAHDGCDKTENRLIKWAWMRGKAIYGSRELFYGLSFEETTGYADALLPEEVPTYWHLDTPSGTRLVYQQSYWNYPGHIENVSTHESDAPTDAQYQLWAQQREDRASFRGLKEILVANQALSKSR